MGCLDSWTFMPLAGGGYTLMDWADFSRLGHLPWRRGTRGYVKREEMVRYQRSSYGLHRTIMGLPKGDRREVDHINRDPLDNRRGNLRVCTHAENGQNVGAIGGTSKHRGVSFCKQTGRWRAHVYLNGKQNQLGRFDTEDEAAEVAREFRRTNMPFAEV